MGYLYLFSIVNGMGWSTYLSTSRSLLQELLSEKDIINGNSLIEISLQGGMFTAGGISGICYQIAGFEFILIANSIAFILSCLLISRLRHNSVIKNHSNESYLASFNNGINYLLKRPYVFSIGIVAIIPLVATMLYNVVLPEYVNESVNGSSIYFGLSDMFYGSGRLSGIHAAPFAKKFSRDRSVAILFLVSISFLFVLSLNTYIIFLFLGSLIFGLCNSSLRILMNTTIMETVPKSYMVERCRFGWRYL
ncbi:MFS transporter [Paraliobacillus ryukyuensis]|uniref:MFS transporter n=1 Tax=Paraliobacillus ryukyuensis TaxID=200904 RepID=UPI002119AD88|nr:MFS transporter [Paraliobacillus ryukyuensis]